MMTTTTTATTATTATTRTAMPLHFDDLLDIAPANDVERCSPHDPIAGMSLVRQIAASVARRLPSHVDRDELVSLGALGWVESTARFDACRGVPFAAFAAMRVRGAILDGLRACDSLSRGDRKRAQTGVEPTLPRIICDDAQVEAAVAPDAVDADEALVRAELADELCLALDRLSPRTRHIVQRHYFEDVPMRAIGAELGVTESRISQILSAAVAQLRQRFGIALFPRTRKPARPAVTREMASAMAVAS